MLHSLQLIKSPEVCTEHFEVCNRTTVLATGLVKWNMRSEHKAVGPARAPGEIGTSLAAEWAIYMHIRGEANENAYTAQYRAN